MIKEYLALKNLYINKKMYKQDSHIMIDESLVHPSDITSGLIIELIPEPPEKQDKQPTEDENPKIIDNSVKPKKAPIDEPVEIVEPKDETEGNSDTDVQETEKAPSRKRRTTKKAG